MRTHFSIVALFAASLAAGCGYNPHPKNGSSVPDGGGSVMDGAIPDVASASYETGPSEASASEVGGETGVDGNGGMRADGSLATGGAEVGGDTPAPYDSTLGMPEDVPSATIDGGKDANVGGRTGTGGAGGAVGVGGAGGIGGAGDAGKDAPISTGGAGGTIGTGGISASGGSATDAPIATGGSGGIVATGGTGGTATGGVASVGGTNSAGGTATGGIIGTGGVGTGGIVSTGGAGTGGTTTSCTNACTAGTTCLSGTSLQTCAPASNGCTVATTSTCSTGLVCERIGPADCLDPNWAEWPIPNSQDDVTGGAPNLQNYTDNGDGTVTDNVTGLMWQQAVPGTYSWEQAVAYCPMLMLAGYGDWRLPSLIELVSIVDYGQANPSINVTYFPSTPASYFWSSTPVASSPGAAWSVHFQYGELFGNRATSNGFDVRCVR
jgi:hypothetical protein